MPQGGPTRAGDVVNSRSSDTASAFGWQVPRSACCRQRCPGRNDSAGRSFQGRTARDDMENQFFQHSINISLRSTKIPPVDVLRDDLENLVRRIVPRGTPAADGAGPLRMPDRPLGAARGATACAVANGGAVRALCDAQACAPPRPEAPHAFCGPDGNRNRRYFAMESEGDIS